MKTICQIFEKKYFVDETLLALSEKSICKFFENFKRSEGKDFLAYFGLHPYNEIGLLNFVKSGFFLYAMLMEKMIENNFFLVDHNIFVGMPNDLAFKIAYFSMHHYSNLNMALAIWEIKQENIYSREMKAIFSRKEQSMMKESATELGNLLIDLISFMRRKQNAYLYY